MTPGNRQETAVVQFQQAMRLKDERRTAGPFVLGPVFLFSGGDLHESKYAKAPL